MKNRRTLLSPRRRTLTAFRAILRREPTKTELDTLARSSFSDEGFFHLLRDMVESREFLVQILPSLVATGTRLEASKPVFFLHVPKTGGTSIRLAIGDALGVPAFNLYGKWPEADKTVHGFWPYWAGHAQVSYFPETHRGTTFFRESRSRVLSLFRQNDFLQSGGRRHGWGYRGEPVTPTARFLDFPTWLSRGIESRDLSILHFFLPSSEHPVSRVRSREETLAITDLSQKEIRKQLAGTLSRFDSAAWLHDSEGVLDAIEKITTKRPSTLPSENTFDSKDYHYRQIRLTKEDHAALESIAQADRPVIEGAIHAGFIPPLDQGLADELFEKTAIRLGFHL